MNDIYTIAFATTNGGDLYMETKVYTDKDLAMDALRGYAESIIEDNALDTDADTLIAQHTTTYPTGVKVLTYHGEYMVELKNVKL